MRIVFADTHYWIALADVKDEWHRAAQVVGTRLGPMRIVTTDEVLIEFLAFFRSAGIYWRDKAVQLVKAVMADPNITVIPQTRDSFLTGISLYENRLDKGYSLTDCISMETMRKQGLADVLTHDHHFTQEGFIVLLTDKNV
jgi:predicted nucleic acid-binding protein